MPAKAIPACANIGAVAPPLSPPPGALLARAAAASLADLARQEIAHRCRRDIARGERPADTVREDERELAGANLLVLGHETQQGLRLRPFVAGNVLDVRRQAGACQVAADPFGACRVGE